tara:strand:+ start:1622 stop:2629 length:1008 start_codon:yes stop_codon:yes gene_type:complete
MVDAMVVMGNRPKRRSQESAHSFDLTLLPVDVLETIVRHLGLHALPLRVTSRYFAEVALPPGVALALTTLRVGPSMPTKMHALRRTTRACTLVQWDYFTYRASLHWRLEWAQMMPFFEKAPINVLIDAFKATPVGAASFFGTIHLGNIKTAAYLRAFAKLDAERAKRIEQWQADQGYGDEEGPGFRVEGSDYTSHARLALYKAIEARVWDVCMGTDLKCPLSSDEVVHTMRRVFDAGRVRNGRCFHFTTKGWLKYTPFLLAAHALNLPLLRYLAARSDTDLCDRSAAGNNAHTIAKHTLQLRGCTDAEMDRSPVLQFLKRLGLKEEAYVVEGARF